MEEITTVGLDLAKNVFQFHGSDRDGRVLLRKKLRREQLLPFFAKQPACIVAMEACSSSHHWGREIGALGHTVRLIPPAYVKPFVKRQKNDASDAEAICEAALRPTMRFVAVKSEQTQAAAMVFRTRDLLVRQRTQIINTLRGFVAKTSILLSYVTIGACNSMRWKRMTVNFNGAQRGVDVDHATLNRWVVRYAPQIANQAQKRKRRTLGSWRVDETYIKVKGKWTYLYRAVDRDGQTLDFMLSERRNRGAARCFFKTAIASNGVPDKIVIDQSGANLAGAHAVNRIPKITVRSKMIEIL